MFNNCLPKIKPFFFLDNEEKCGTARQGTEDNIIRHMRIAYLIPKTTDAHSEYVIIIFQGNDANARDAHCYVIHICSACRVEC